ncbi:MAG: HlyD family efflux transporter periplasmic adaptor subunit [Candidatus Omnitrophica bacterium]|nr:HlyD family efflux transporter periplasmic adaptor subunit [Candidatus Omnitrophota bacterium]
MIRNKIWKILAVLVLIAAITVLVIKIQRKPVKEIFKEISPVIGSIQSVINSTAIVQPDNRLEIKPPINGRIDKMLVREGDVVKEGQIVAWMSSTERAALLDAARAQGADAMKYWEEVYKPTPLISPIAGEVIVSTKEPGQTVTAADIVIVLSDHLIAQAQVDETDIGKVKALQEAVVTLDAYPQIKVKGKVDHIFYESKLVNNVNIYQVDIVLETVPAVFRSGMTATINIIENTKDNILLIPLEAVKYNKAGAYVLLSAAPGQMPVERNIETGISDEKNTEVLSGLSESDKVLISGAKYVPVQAPKQGSNPLMPRRGGR